MQSLSRVTCWNRLIRFISKETSNVCIGEPNDAQLDVGLAARHQQEISVDLFDGQSILRAGSRTGAKATVERLLSPLSQHETGTIRCFGLNYHKHAQEAKIATPTVPTLFLKPETALADPYPAPTLIPKFTLEHDACDYESELAIVIGRACKNVSEEEALDYVLGYTAANDVSSRRLQFEQSQWSFSKGFDSACPIGPCIVSASFFTDPAQFKIRGIKNGTLMQESGLDDLIFSIPRIVSFLSQGTTLKPGTVILTGTPAGVGNFQNPKQMLKDGDEFAVEILPHIGTLITRFEAEV